MKLTMRITIEKKSFRQTMLSLNGIRIVAELVFLFILTYLNIISWQYLVNNPIKAGGWSEEEPLVIYGNNGNFLYPTGIAVNGNGNIYIVDTGNSRIQIFDNKGQFLSEFGSQGYGQGQFLNPSGVAISSNGQVYVADSGNHRIQVFDSNNQFLSQFGEFGSGPGQFNLPQGIALDNNGNIYVADMQNYRIQVFSQNGQFLSQFGELGSDPGQFLEPIGVAVDANGLIYVADFNNHRIQIFDENHQFLYAFGEFGGDPGALSKPEGVAVDSNGNIYVADMDNHRVQIFDSGGRYLKEIKGFREENFSRVQGLAVRNGAIYILDNGDCSQGLCRAVVMPVGSLIIKNGRTISPLGVAVDSNNGIYMTIADAITGLDSSGQFLLRIGSQGSQPGEFNNPTGIAIDDSDNIYVADTGNDRVQIFNNRGTLINYFGETGNTQGKFNQPKGVTVRDNKIYVADTGNSRIQIFDTSGQYLSEFDGSDTAGEALSSPEGVTVDSGGNIYVADTGNSRIKIFNASGQFLRGFGTFGSVSGQFTDPIGIIVDSNGNIYVADSGNNRIQFFDNRGEFLKELIYTGNKDPFSYPRSIALSSNFYIADTQNDQLVIFPFFRLGDPPASPSVVDLSISTSSALITWDNSVNGAQGFIIDASVDNENYTNTTTVAVEVNNVVLSDLSPNSLYYFRIASYNNYGTSDYAVASGYTRANIPVFLETAAEEDGAISLSWQGDASYYIVENVTNSNNSDWLIDTSYRFTGLECDTDYTFRIKGRNQNGEETDWSEPVIIHTLGCEGSSVVPMIVETSAKDNGTVNISWEGNSSAYYIESMIGSFNSGWIERTAYQFSNLGCSNNYAFRIKGRDNRNVETEWSEPIVVRTLDCQSSTGAASVPAISPNTYVTVGFADSDKTTQLLRINSIFNAAKIAVSDNQEFKYSSWQEYNPGEEIKLPKVDSPTIFIKFLSPEGGESQVIEVKNNLEFFKENNKTISQKAEPTPSISSAIPSLTPDISFQPGKDSQAPANNLPGKNSPRELAAETDKKKDGGRSGIEVVSPVAPIPTPPSPVLKSGASQNLQKALNLAAPDLKIGNSSKEVAAVQAALKDLGYYKYIKATGYFGPITFQAVKKFQKDKNIPTTGVIDQPTKKALGSYIK